MMRCVRESRNQNLTDRRLRGIRIKDPLWQVGFDDPLEGESPDFRYVVEIIPHVIRRRQRLARDPLEWLSPEIARDALERVFDDGADVTERFAARSDPQTALAL